MINMKRIILVASLALCIMLLPGCSNVSAGTGSVATASPNANVSPTNISVQSATAAQTVSLHEDEYTDEDLDDRWDIAISTLITLNGSSIEVSGEGAKATGSVVTITRAGTYVISGTLSDGQIAVNAAKSDTVRLVLNGANITCLTSAAIYGSQAGKLIITLAEGTENTVVDGGSSFVYANTTDEGPDAAIFSKDNLTINGSGTLSVNAGFNNGIGSKDNLLIVNANLTVNAANHGVRGRDSVTVLDGSIKITAGGDGIQSNNDKDTTKGWILIKGGTFDITSGNDGIQAETTLSIAAGKLNMNAGGGVSNVQTVFISDAESGSCKGLKAVVDIAITGGNFTIDSTDDSIHANGNIAISGGEFTLSSGDDGIHADGDLTVSGGSISVAKSYEGMEASAITLSGGTIHIVSSDDGLNAAGGSDANAGGGRFGRDSFASKGAYYINITGGSLTLVAGGDGVDSNGDINISGGTVVSLINSTADNGALDCDGALTFTGGTVIYGGTGTGSSPGGSSTQSYVFLSSGIAAGTEIAVKQDGKTLIAVTPTINCQYLALSSPEIASGKSYEVYNGSTLLTTVTAGTGGSGMGGGRGPGGQGPGGQRPGR